MTSRLYLNIELFKCDLQVSPYVGPLSGGPHCHMSNLRNGYVNCHYFSYFHVAFKMVSSGMSNLRNGQCHVDNMFSHVDRLHVACQF